MALEYLFKAGNVACYILEPMSRLCPELASTKVLKRVRELCNQYNVVLIFDEMIMGFRYAMAGGQEYYGVVPDLACYGKAIANGFPLAVLVGKRELMQELSQLQVSGTYFGDVLSMAAAVETIKFMEEKEVITALKSKGDLFNEGVRKIIASNSLDGTSMVRLKGFGPWSAFVWDENYVDEENYFLQEIVKRGILYSRDHFIMYAHSEEDVQRTLSVYDEVLSEISHYHSKGIKVGERLEGGIDKGLFPR